MTADVFGVAPRYRVLGRTMIKLAGLFDGEIRESAEMLYQNDAPYLFDSGKFSRHFGVVATPYAEGIRQTAAAYRSAVHENTG